MVVKFVTRDFICIYQHFCTVVLMFTWQIAVNVTLDPDKSWKEHILLLTSHCDGFQFELKKKIELGTIYCLQIMLI